MNVPDIRPDFDQPNYDKSKIAQFTLEDPLQFLDGSRVTTPEDWKLRRREILNIFASEMFGQEPPAPEAVVTELVEEKNDALAGFAIRSQYKMWFKSDKSGPCIDWMLLRPRHAKKAVPTILYLNYRGCHEMIPDQDVIIPRMWIRQHNFNNPVARGVMTDPNNNTYLPIGILISAGYAVLSACYSQFSPDPTAQETDERYTQEKFPYTGVFDLWGKRDESRTDNPTALGAWAWGLSRGQDLIESIPALDAKATVVTGCSRLGKSALLAAARDERFPVCVANQCGGGGVTLAKRDYGENVATEMRKFTHWYCKAYKKYERNPAKLLTFDQHLLVSAIAPRRLLVAGFDSPWFDTEGEFISCRAASPAWELHGLPGFPQVEFPDDYDTSAIGEYLGYYHRTEAHGIAAFDWYQLLKFAGMN